MLVPLIIIGSTTLLRLWILVRVFDRAVMLRYFGVSCLAMPRTIGNSPGLLKEHSDSSRSTCLCASHDVLPGPARGQFCAIVAISVSLADQGIGFNR